MESAEELVMTAEDEAAEEAALEAGFNDTDITPMSTENTTKPEETATEVPGAPETPETKVDPAGPATPKFLTQDDLAAALAAQNLAHQQEMQKIHDKVFGKVGELKQRIDNMKAAGGFTAKTREKLTAEFPELAAMLFDSEEPEPAPAPATTAPAPVVPAAPVTHEPTPEEIQEAQDLLSLDHPDWADVVNSDGFNAWVATLPPTVAKRLNETYDPAFVADKLTRYKNWQATQKKPAASTPKPTNDRLESAVVPRGVPGGKSILSDDDEEAAMEAAFKAGRN